MRILSFPGLQKHRSSASMASSDPTPTKRFSGLRVFCVWWWVVWLGVFWKGNFRTSESVECLVYISWLDCLGILCDHGGLTTQTEPIESVHVRSTLMWWKYCASPVGLSPMLVIMGIYTVEVYFGCSGVDKRTPW